MSFIFRTFAAPLNVQHIISNFWFFESDEGIGAYTHYATATVFPRIVFGLEGCFSISSDDGRQINLNSSGFNGQTNTFMKFTVYSKKVSVFGVVLKPYSLFSLTGHIAEILSNEYLDFNSIWSKLGNDLEEKVVTAPNNYSRIKIISSFLEKKWNKNCRSQGEIIIANAVNELINLEGVLDINNISDQYSLSLRQFERNFKKMTGFSPKHFHRISRFEKAADICLENRFKMTDIAYRFGYFDQAHFIKDFKQFSGFTPLTYQNVASSDIVFAKT
ncbi:helix-turn-helix transcriptional regulator [Sphingobacterium sp. DN00404]|uniref:Helix-turn-helix transcriptional regulator n=1 Tax=Sphingobacterium micropteri TaxID=2763501 RepID=A0ABR7YUA9_9SPHI|nr:AraC family transcriptional regulator [Sphingobacterium micropteri]MBD1434939.1 helix-turn-helix transcriptional regulator [Sphingobacterium micropteri]